MFTLPVASARNGANLRGETLRKVAHAVSGVFCAVGIYFVPSRGAVVTFGLVLAAALVLAIELRLMPASMVQNERTRDYGYAMYALAIAVVAWLFWPSRAVFAGAFLILGLADSSAALVGTASGRRRVSAWGCHRTVEGAVAFGGVTLLVALAVLAYSSGQLGPRELLLAAFIAFTTASLELIVPSAFDNLLLPLWSALLLSLAVDSGLDTALWWGLAAMIGYGLAPLFYRLRWVDGTAAIGTALLTSSCIGLAGFGWILAPTLFFVSSSLLTRFRQQDKTARRPRNLKQMLVNGALPMLPGVLAYSFTQAPVWYWVTIGAIAAANADTWSSEIGRLSRRQPIHLRTLRHVPSGTSGAVTALGLVATVVGGCVVGIVASVVSSSWLIAVGVLAGIGGSVIDSLLGAWFQGQFLCPTCQRTGDKQEHCRSRGRRVSGLSWLDNDGVNAAANLFGMLIAAIAFGYLG